MRRKKRPALDGKTVVISGAGSGIGRALARRLSSRGCPLALIDFDPIGLAETESMISGTSLTRELDVRDRLAWMQFAAEVAEWSRGPIGAVFNNAGVALSASVASGTIEEHDRVNEINFGGVVNGVNAFLPILLTQGQGTIVNVSSVFGLMGVPYQSAYCASKFAVRGFTESLRQELDGTGVDAVTVHPGGIRTNIVRNIRMVEDPLGLDRDVNAFAAEFERNARTTPERAAEVIQNGVENGKSRILIGADAHVIDAMTRIAPTGYSLVLKQFLELSRKQAAREASTSEPKVGQI